MVVEAIALGVPYVVTDNDAVSEVTGGGIGGAWFRRGHPADLAARIGELLSDPERHDAAVDAARRFVQRYRWSDVADATERVLAAVVTAGRR